MNTRKTYRRFFVFSDAYRDPEVEEWAARKIQSSFKQYKRQKSGILTIPPRENCVEAEIPPQHPGKTV
jgi:hypothetical protein